MKTLCLLLIPIILGNFSADDFPKDVLKVFNLFRRLVLYINNSSFTQQELTVLKSHEDDFMKAFIKVFTNYGVTQKVHRTCHYHQSIKFLGNSINFSCFPFEGYLSFLSHGTHSTSNNLYELYFLSTINSNITTYFSIFNLESNNKGRREKGKPIEIQGITYALKRKGTRNEGQGETNEYSSYEILYNVEDDIKYDVRDAQARANNFICYKHAISGNPTYGKITNILYNGLSVILEVREYEVVGWREMGIDDLFLDEKKFSMSCVSPSQILCKFVTYPYEGTEYFIVTSIHKELY